MYTLKVVAGALIAGLWLWRRAPHAGFDHRTMHRWIWSVVLAALIGGRIGYGVGNIAHFAQQPALLIRLDRVGGLHGGGAMLGVLLAVGLWSGVKRQSVSMLLRFLSPAVLVVAAGAWWGSIDAGCAWGRKTLAAADSTRWLTALLPDIYQTVTLRYAVQPLGAVWALALALLAAALEKYAGLALALYWLGSAGLTLLRGDPVPRWGDVRLDTMLDLALAIGIAVLTLHKAKGIRRG